jgi:hypothetical protein
MVGLLTLAGSASASDWWTNVKVKGDLRYRHEMLDLEDKDARHRHRMRARLGVFGAVSDRTKVAIQLATGSDDPVSTNQTLDDAFTTKRIGLDLAYFETSHEKLSGFTLTGGKMNNPFFKAGGSELLWDSDWNPEGGALSFSRDLDNVSIQMLGAGFWIDESSSGDDAWMGAGQGVLRLHMNEKKSSLAIGAAYYSYVNVEGHAPFYDSEDSYGNTVVVTGEGDDAVMRYASDFDLMEVFAEFTHNIQNLPVTVMADYVTNTSADSLNSGWLVGFELGAAKKSGQWSLRYCYREVEADAVVGLFTDSDFREGGTDAKGHEFGGSLALDKNTNFNVTYFANKIGLDAAEADFGRLQIDVQLKF